MAKQNISYVKTYLDTKDEIIELVKSTTEEINSAQADDKKAYAIIRKYYNSLIKKRLKQTGIPFSRMERDLLLAKNSINNINESRAIRPEVLLNASILYGISLNWLIAKDYILSINKVFDLKKLLKAARIRKTSLIFQTLIDFKDVDMNIKISNTDLEIKENFWPLYNYALQTKDYKKFMKEADQAWRKIVGDRLKKLPVKLKEIERRLELPEYTLNNIVQAQRPLSIDLAKRISEEFNIDVNYLLAKEFINRLNLLVNGDFFPNTDSNRKLMLKKVMSFYQLP